MPTCMLPDVILSHASQFFSSNFVQDEEWVFKKALIPLTYMHTMMQSSADDSTAVTQVFPSTSISSAWLKVFEKSLEALLWGIYSAKSRSADKHVLYVADAAAAGLKSEKAVLLGAEEGLDLMFCGPISTEPSQHARRIAELENGLVFYMHPVAGPPQGEIIVPAWLAKPTPKSDLATLDFVTEEIKVYVTDKGDASLVHPHAFCSETFDYLEVIEIKKTHALARMKKALKKADRCSKKWKKVKKTVAKAKHSQQQTLPTLAHPDHLRQTLDPPGHPEETQKVEAEGKADHGGDAAPETKMFQAENGEVETEGGKTESKDQEGASTVVEDDEEAQATLDVPKHTETEKGEGEEEETHQMGNERPASLELKDTDADMVTSENLESELEDTSVDSAGEEIPEPSLPQPLVQWDRKQRGQLTFGPAKVRDVIEMTVQIHMFLSFSSTFVTPAFHNVTITAYRIPT